MNALALLCSLLLSPPPDPDFPKIADPDPRQEMHHETYPWLGLEAAVLWTTFDQDLKIKDAWGGGVDATVTLDYGTKAFLGFRVGYMGWNTETDRDVPGGDGVQVRQYRVGIFGQFPFRFMEVGVGANTGAYRFRREKNNDTAMFFEFQGHLGARPHPQVWVGIVGMMTMTGTDFNDNDHHFDVILSIGPAGEFRF